MIGEILLINIIGITVFKSNNPIKKKYPLNSMQIMAGAIVINIIDFK